MCASVAIMAAKSHCNVGGDGANGDALPTYRSYTSTCPPCRVNLRTGATAHYRTPVANNVLLTSSATASQTHISGTTVAVPR
jgi:hypothetical protein